MDQNYDKPYRGLPTEIRLQIWKLMIPDRAIIATKTFKRKQRKNWPSTQIQLLRLNRQIHDEVLPIFRNIEVYLHPEFSNRESWRDIVSALQSPTLNKLTVSWEQVHAMKLEPSRPQWLSTFFLNSVLVDMSHPLHRITISMENPFFCGCSNAALFRSYWRDPGVVATLAAAYLQRNLATEVCVKIFPIPSIGMPLWSAERLSQCLTGTAEVNTGAGIHAPNYLDFRRLTVEKIGSDLDSDVHITAKFSKDKGEHYFAGFIKFRHVAH